MILGLLDIVLDIDDISKLDSKGIVQSPIMIEWYVYSFDVHIFVMLLDQYCDLYMK